MLLQQPRLLAYLERAGNDGLVVVFQGIAEDLLQCSGKKTYSGLTYDYMEGYILAHGTTAIAKKFYRMREIP